MNYNIYTWQNDVWSRLTTLRSGADSRLPHAMLLHGRNGIGKLDFAMALAQSLLCESGTVNGLACGTCASCGYFSQNNHPDFRLLAPEQDLPGDETETLIAVNKVGKKTQISISQVRELADFVGLTSHRSGGRKIVVIHPAEALNPASANALLKVLEEPPPEVAFILVTHNPQRLLPTILSRCHKIEMPVPAESDALAWLKNSGVDEAAHWLNYAGGAPLAALNESLGNSKFLESICKALARGARLDPFSAATTCMANGMETSIKALQKWIYDLLNYSLTGQIRYYQQYTSAMQSLAGSVNLGAALDFQRKLDEARRSAAHPLNHELQLESLFLQYTQLFSLASKP